MLLKNLYEIHYWLLKKNIFCRQQHTHKKEKLKQWRFVVVILGIDIFIIH